jgi:hypothetical protein
MRGATNSIWINDGSVRDPAGLRKTLGINFGALT